MKRFVALTLAGILGTTAAHAVTWDTNDDGSIDAVEFAKGNLSANTFNRFDDNSDGAITPNEVGLDAPDAVFMKADNNADGMLTEDELTVATFTMMDTNADRKIDADEMKAYEEMDPNEPWAGIDALRKGSDVSQ